MQEMGFLLLRLMLTLDKRCFVRLIADWGSTDPHLTRAAERGGGISLAEFINHAT